MIEQCILNWNCAAKHRGLLATRHRRWSICRSHPQTNGRHTVVGYVWPPIGLARWLSGQCFWLCSASRYFCAAMDNAAVLTTVVTIEWQISRSFHIVDRSDAWYFRDYVHGILGFECMRFCCEVTSDTFCRGLTFSSSSFATFSEHCLKIPSILQLTIFSGQPLSTCKNVKDIGLWAF